MRLLIEDYPELSDRVNKDSINFKTMVNFAGLYVNCSNDYFTFATTYFQSQSFAEKKDQGHGSSGLVGFFKNSLKNFYHKIHFMVAKKISKKVHGPDNHARVSRIKIPGANRYYIGK